MSLHSLHIISFDVPYPPDYGGVIDIFYKIKKLHEKKIDIYLHCFIYGRNRRTELEQYCKKVYYYPRILALKYFFSTKPFIVKSRCNTLLLSNLEQDNFPILFEGLHSTFFLKHKNLKQRLKIVRMHNIEHKYYFSLSKYEKSPSKWFYFITEAIKLKFYERILHKADYILSISQKEQEYFEKKYKNSIYIPAFHQNEELKSQVGIGKYILYHGNLSVKENENALFFLIDKVFSKIDFEVVVAGKNAGQKLQEKIKKVNNIKLFNNPKSEKMAELIKNAQISVLFTLQTTGLKLKLINSLFESRFCIANDKMLFGTKLDKICIVANSPQDIINEIESFIDKRFSLVEIEMRKEILLREYSNENNVTEILNLL